MTASDDAVRCQFGIALPRAGVYPRPHSSRTEHSTLRRLIAFFLLLASTQAAAQQRGLGLYAGVGVGRFQFEEEQGPLSVVLDERRVDEIVGEVTQTIGIRSVRLDDSELSWKLFGGWAFTENLGVEVGYGRANELASAYTEQVGDVTVSASLSTDIDIATARVMGYLPFRVGAFFGGLGYFSAETSSTQNVGLVVSGVGSVQNAVNLGGTATDSGPTAIVGFRWAVSSLVLRTDYELFDMNAGSAATLNVGVSLGF